MLQRVLSARSGLFGRHAEVVAFGIIQDRVAICFPDEARSEG
jgi:hypothetical protein